MERKSLASISLDITEEEYRQMPELSYSTLAKYERGGFKSIETLFEPTSSPSLTFGSAVDAIITGGQEEFDSRFFVADFPEVTDTVKKIIDILFDMYNSTYSNMDLMPNSVIIPIIDEQAYQTNWKPETRCKVIKEKGCEYYGLKFLAKDKTILTTETYQDVLNAVEALRTSDATKYYFEPDNPFEEDIERCYQLKFNAVLNGVGYRCMFDELLISHKNKTIQPIDLKTSFKNEYDFYKSFVDWSYQIQNRLYVRILEENIKKDDYFKDFKILPYKDIVVCKTSLNPLVWDCDFTFSRGTLILGKNNQVEMRDPEVIGKELRYYLDNQSVVPIGIDTIGSNDLRTWINKM